MDNHFSGLTADERYKNDILNEQRMTNELLRQLLQSKEKPLTPKKPPTQRKPAPQKKPTTRGKTK